MKEFEFLSKGCGEARLQGWTFLGIGVVVVFVGIVMAYPPTNGFVVVVLWSLAALFVAAGLAVVGPRPLQVYPQGFVVPTGGLLGRLVGPGWVRYDEVTQVEVLSFRGGAMVTVRLLKGGKLDVPLFMVGSEGLARLQERLRDYHVGNPNTG